jgi:biopolymer transport protein ExbB/TolQ
MIAGMNSTAWMVLPVGDVFFAFGESTLPGKVIVLALFAGSIVAWSIMITKWIELRRATASSGEFLASFRAQAHPVALYVQGRAYESSPLFVVYQHGCRELGRELDLPDASRSEWSGGGMVSGVRLSMGQLEGVGSVAERLVADQALLLERHMNVLATAVSSAPFLGLLGTVWGVMDGFSGMAREGAATLSAVAPGISAALLTTVVGLLVALPSAIGYNLLTNRIRAMTVELDNFAQEFQSAVRRFYVSDHGR